MELNVEKNSIKNWSEKIKGEIFNNIFIIQQKGQDLVNLTSIRSKYVDQQLKQQKMGHICLKQKRKM